MISQTEPRPSELVFRCWRSLKFLLIEVIAICSKIRSSRIKLIVENKDLDNNRNDRIEECEEKMLYGSQVINQNLLRNNNLYEQFKSYSINLIELRYRWWRAKLAYENTEVEKNIKNRRLSQFPISFLSLSRQHLTETTGICWQNFDKKNNKRRLMLSRSSVERLARSDYRHVSQIEVCFCCLMSHLKQ